MGTLFENMTYCLQISLSYVCQPCRHSAYPDQGGSYAWLCVWMCMNSSSYAQSIIPQYIHTSIQQWTESFLTSTLEGYGNIYSSLLLHDL